MMGMFWNLIGCEGNWGGIQHRYSCKKVQLNIIADNNDYISASEYYALAA